MILSLKTIFLKLAAKKYKYLRDLFDKNIVSLVFKETKTKEISLNNIFESTKLTLFNKLCKLKQKGLRADKAK